VASADTIHAAAWVAWLAAVLITLTTTRNPIYIAIILLWVATVSKAAQWVTSNTTSSRRGVPVSPLRFALIVVIISILFNMLSVHVGDTVLWRLPAGLPLISAPGGLPFTLEAAVYGALNGLVLAGLFAAFALVNQTLPIRALVHLAPRAYYPAAVVVSIAVTFIPTTLRHYGQIREAQAVRGHQARGVRGWLPIFLPLLIGGLERALQLAEAMMARGFAGGESQPYGVETRFAMLAGLMAFSGGWLLRLAWQQQTVGLVLLWAGVLGIAVAIWMAGRRHPHTVYRPAPWRGRDWFVALTALIVAAAFSFSIPGVERQSLFYYPYPALTFPDFDLGVGVATWGLLSPALVLGIRAAENLKRARP
jgi:energy-coupling factor transport system permease protein